MEVPTIRPMIQGYGSGDIPPKYGLIWHSTYSLRILELSIDKEVELGMHRDVPGIFQFHGGYELFS